MAGILHSGILAVWRKFFSVYGASIASFLFTLLILPKLHATLTEVDWIRFSIFITAIGFAMVLDLGVSQILPRNLAVYSSSITKIEDSIDRYRAVSGIVGITFGIGLFSYLLLYVKADLSAEESALFCYLGGSIWIVLSYFNNIYICAMQGLRMNSQYVAISGLSILSRTVMIVVVMEFDFLSLRSVIAIYLICVATENLFYKASLGNYIRFWSFDIKNGIKTLLNRDFLRTVLFISSASWLSQIDRLITIRSLSLVEYSKYVLISTFCLLFLLAQYPLLRYLVPRMTEAISYFKRHIKALVLSYFLLGAFSIYIAPLMFSLWSGGYSDSAIAEAVRVLSFGIFLQSIYNFGYQKMLIDGAYRGIFVTNCLAFAFVFSFSFFIPKNIQMGGWIWVVFAACQLSCLCAYLTSTAVASWCRQ